MSNVVIKVENLSKQYRLGEVGTGSMRDDFKRFRYRMMGKEDPFLTIGEENNRNTQSQSDYVWALKDIYFEVNQGDVVGVIGRNGAGKSTLLKILSRTTGPTTGSVKMKGRIASLLEVGTGFHGELSGRENIFLNGAIMGLRKHEIKTKLDEIIAFAGVERYIDTPVKRYSSGMYVRLAFAVAAYLDPDILIVDEVLAVGDVEFQKKALGKMKDVSNVDGRTVLFVSHNMSAIQKLCNSGILLKNGQVDFIGEISEVLDKYIDTSKVSESIFNIKVPENSIDLPAYAYCIQIEDIFGNPSTEIPVGEFWQIRVKFKINKKLNHFIIGIGLTNSMEIPIRTVWSEKMDLNEGEYEVIFKEDNLLLASGLYNIILGMSSFERSIQYLDNVAFINISDLKNSNLDERILRTSNCGFYLNPMNLKIFKI